MVLRGRSAGIGVQFMEAFLEAAQSRADGFLRRRTFGSPPRPSSVRQGSPPRELNFGDCMAYAVAKAHEVPLLYKGDDFPERTSPPPSP